MALLAASCYLARPGTGMRGTTGIQQVSSPMVLLCRYYKELIEIPVGIILLGALGSLLLSRCVRPALRMHALSLPPTCCAAGQTSVPEQIWSPLHTVWRTQLVCTAPAALGHQEWLSACRLPPGRAAHRVLHTCRLFLPPGCLRSGRDWWRTNVRLCCAQPSLCLLACGSCRLQDVLPYVAYKEALGLEGQEGPADSAPAQAKQQQQQPEQQPPQQPPAAQPQ